MSDLSFEEDDPHWHPSALFYNVVALMLFGVTALEVALLYPPLDQLGSYFRVGLLVLLSVGMFVVSVGFFMHLFFDPPLCMVLFAIGMIIAVGTVVALVNVMPQAPHPLTPVVKAKHAYVERLEPWRRVELG